MGTESDFVLFSLPKAYPMQFGGMLYFNKEKWNIRETLNKEEKNYIGSRVSNYAIKEIDFIKTKKNNYRKLVKIFKSLGCAPYFYYEENETPGVFMFTPPANVNLDALKEHGWKHGIECSIFYGKHAFFIPTHQFLTSIDLEYFKVVFSNFLGKSE
jgi:hypothetical protein